ncbi:class A beta-lactamase [Streptomyces nymphaeiformis]|uniref:Beta-lactamase n=1 Tax=Streptomyces nymphaeiformis TaxID=2663842 RepID=A0A7W7U7I0_9ACTN|nr:class A beta-lactamase [Streptomyces nymphaeiformis]MBB4986497.1 beta-lactamase class A [Streptomyces nymphaeiformis]
MHADVPDLSRRSALALGAGTALTAALAVGDGTAQASPETGGVVARLRRLEREHSARLGVFARDMRSGRTVAYRANERFPMASVFKTLAVAAVLRDLDHDGEFLARRLRYTTAYVERSGYSPITGRAENVAGGMTVSALCDAALRFSDNTAANLLLGELGGPTALTRFCRSIGDRVTRLDRWEPELNSAEPWRVTDTTSPYAIGVGCARLVLGDALERHDRERLTGWLLRNTTSAERFRRGLPADWLLADKTGSGRHGGADDVGVAWRPDGTPIVLAVLTTKAEEDAPADDPLVAGTAALLAGELGTDV